jgi:hypothetical protein
VREREIEIRGKGIRAKVAQSARNEEGSEERRNECIETREQTEAEAIEASMGQLPSASIVRW